MGRFTIPRKKTASDFQKRSDIILGSFKKVQTDLSALVHEQEQHEVGLQQQIAELEEEKSNVAGQIASTKSILKKIDDFLS